jgi:hypothetical protein
VQAVRLTDCAPRRSLPIRRDAFLPARRARLQWRYEKFLSVIRSGRRRVYRLTHAPQEFSPRVAVILGCQRSGTTLMLNLFDSDLRILTFAEESILTSQSDPQRLKALDEVNEHLAGLSAPLIVLKPLVESQRAPALLSALHQAKVLWMFRDYHDVAASNLRTFGPANGIIDLQLLLTNDPPNWRGEYVPSETRAVLERFYSPDMDPYDAAALFWWARNMLLFQLDLAGRQDVRLCSYEQLIANPADVMSNLYRFLDMPVRSGRLGKSVHARALERGRSVALSPSVETLCHDLHEHLVTQLPVWDAT